MIALRRCHDRPSPAASDLSAYCLDVARRAVRPRGCWPSFPPPAKTPGCAPPLRLWMDRSQEILAANEKDLAMPPRRDLTAAQTGSAAADAGPFARRRRRAARDRGPARPGRTDPFQHGSAQRPGSPQSRRAARRHLLHLRIAAQCDGRRGRPVRQERQRRHPARRPRGVSLQRRAAPDFGGLPRATPGCQPTRCNSSPRRIGRPWAIFSS